MTTHEGAEALRKEAREAYNRGDIGEAKYIFARIVEQFPDSTAAADARQYLSTNPPAPDESTPSKPTVQLVRVVDFDFFNLVWLLFKVSVAMIPAAAMVFLLYAFLIAVFMGGTR